MDPIQPFETDLPTEPAGEDEMIPVGREVLDMGAAVLPDDARNEDAYLLRSFDSRLADKKVIKPGEAIGAGEIRRRLTKRHISDIHNFGRQAASSSSTPHAKPAPDFVGVSTTGEAKSRRPRFFLEISAGCARLSGAVQQAGGRIMQPLELQAGASMDVTKPEVIGKICGWIKAG